jgi:valyl-tRNA synthetase
MNIQDKTITNKQPELDLINAWMINSLENCLGVYHDYFKKNEFSLALQSIEKVFWNNFCDNYIEIVKDQFFNPQNYSQEQLAATYWTLREVSFKVLQLYAPFLPHITEYLYQHILKDHYKANSIHLTQLPQAENFDPIIEKNMQLILDIIAQIRKFKTAQQLSLKTEIELLTVGSLTTEQIRLLEKEMLLIKGVCKILQIKFVKDSVSTEIKEHESKWYVTITI